MNLSNQQTVSAKHILVDNEELCSEVKNKIAQWKNYLLKKLQNNILHAHIKNKVEILGVFGRGMMVPEFEEAAFGLN